MAFPEAPAVTRFKGDVAAWILAPHVLCMFLSMLLSTRAALAAVAGGDARTWAWWAIGMLVVGGFVLGPAVQKQAFGEWWAGVPYGWDLTDNKTLLAFIAWLPAIVPMWRGRPARGAIVLAAVAMMVVFAIPHSVWGSRDQLGEAGVERPERRASGIDPNCRDPATFRGRILLVRPRGRRAAFGVRVELVGSRRRSVPCIGFPLSSHSNLPSCPWAARAVDWLASGHHFLSFGGEAMRIDVRGHRVELQPALGAYAERRFLTALQRFKERVPSVTVRLIDDNGPKHGVDKRCQVSVLVLRAKPVLVEETNADPYRAIDLAADRVARGSRGRSAAGGRPDAQAAERRASERTGVTPHLVPAR